MKEIFRTILRRWKKQKARKSYLLLYKKIIDSNPELAQPFEGEDEWLAYWKQYDRHLKPTAYRIFARYCGKNINILPFEVLATVIEPALTPAKFHGYYNDKNILPQLVNKNYLPTTFLRNIRGHYYSDNYSPIEKDNIDNMIKDISADIIILKPSMEGSGRGVDKFQRINNKWLNDDMTELSLAYLEANYKNDFLIQEFAEQSSYLAQFNQSSVNTIRIAVYRDLHSEWHILGAVLRIGAKGKVVDNAHQGGMFCGISEDGKLGSYVCNYLGLKQTIFNEIDFSLNEFQLPNYDKLRQFALDVVKNIFHHDLVALDIYVDKNNNPKLIEMNMGDFSPWFFQFTGKTTFGDYTNDVINYCYTSSYGGVFYPHIVLITK